MESFASTSITLLAYIDPGIGSMIFQVLIAGVVVAGFVIKIWWARIKSFVAKLFGKAAEENKTDSFGQSDEN